MEDVTTLYDDLVAIWRASSTLPDSTSESTWRDLEAVIERIRGKLSAELKALPEEERYDIMYELHNEDRGEPYASGAWDYLSALL